MHLSVEGGASLNPRVRAPRQPARVPKEAAWALVDLASTLAVDSGIGLHSRNSAPQVSLASSASEKLQVHRRKSQRSCTVIEPRAHWYSRLPLSKHAQLAKNGSAQQEEQPAICVHGGLTAPGVLLLWL